MKLKTGDKVKFNRAFVQRCGYSKDIADLIGTITAERGMVGKNQYLKVVWPYDSEEKGVLSCNIIKVGQIELD